MNDPKLSIEKLAEKLSKGLGGWLMYEHHSHRADLFSEKYLTSGIGNILSGNYGSKIIAEFTHPILKERKAGRPPQIDFVICENNRTNRDKEDKNSIKKIDNIKLALESKWVGTKTTSTPKIGDILWDLVRLELLNHNFQTESIFVLAGKKSQMDAIFEHPQFTDKTSKGKNRNLLTIRNSPTKLNLIGGSVERLQLLTNYLKNYKRVEAPSNILITGVRKYPKDCNNFENEVCVWGISSCTSAKRYKYSELMERLVKRKK